MRNRLIRFIEGRYGVDKLHYFLFIVSLVLLFIGSFAVNTFIKAFFLLIALAITVIALLRIFSRNKYKRSLENLMYIKLRDKVSGFVKTRIKMFRERKTHRFFKCPNCKVTLRVPKGKGSIRITCPKCRESFTEKT